MCFKEPTKNNCFLISMFMDVFSQVRFHNRVDRFEINQSFYCGD